MTRIRAESSAVVGSLTMTTLFIKNDEGIWHVLSGHACDVSKVFTPDQFLGVFPFFRLFSIPQHPYELQLSDGDYQGAAPRILHGKLSHAPGAGAPDIAREFRYTLHKEDGRLRSLHEETFAQRSLDLEFDKWELNQPLDDSLFELPDQPRIIPASLDHYLDLRNQDMIKILNA